MRKVMHDKKHILGIVGAFLVVLFITLLLPGTATAVKNVENTFAVVITTGNDVGDQVVYFALEYVDVDGYTHIEYAFLNQGAHMDSLQMAGNLSDCVSETPLDRGQTNTYFFEPIYEVAQVTGLDIYCQGQQGKMHAWDVSGLRLYRVDQILDVVTQGQGNIVRFNGSQIAYLQENNRNGGVTFSWTGDTLFQLRADRTASYQLVFESAPYSMEYDHLYSVRLDIADFIDAGFEQMNQAYNEDKSLREVDFGEYMAIQIEYIDIFGDSRLVTQPVMTNAIAWLMESGIPWDTKIAGFAQQGDTIVFDCVMQDMQSISGITLMTGTEAEAVLKGMSCGTESASFTGISVYKAADVKVIASDFADVASAPEYTFSGSPLFYHTSTLLDGEVLAENSRVYLSMHKYEYGAILSPVIVKEQYMIDLIAYPSEIVQVPDDILVELRYVDINGEARETEAFSVRKEANEFYGYWPASGKDFAYEGQVNEEIGVHFVVDLVAVEHFTGLTISVPEGSCDWQIAGFRVVRVEHVSKRYCVWDYMTGNGNESNRRYFRNVDGYTVFSMDEVNLIQPGSPCEFDFISQSTQKVDDFDWSTYRYAMTYDQCTSNLGLTKVRENYTVEVQVQSGQTSMLDNYGDNGSKNRFYFMLEFENGVSAYVLANQQLGADGFRSGYTESFVISTNYDYGDLVAVHIIPDDISEDSDPYDKLNIAQIRVRRSDSGSISKEWIVDNVGWIGIDYRDEGASSSIVGQQGRKEAELARSYPVSYGSYALNLEFRLGIGAYTESGSGTPFYGTMEATLEYYNKDGDRKQITFDVIRAMYEYANKAPVYLNDGTNGASGSPLAVPDNNFMFRENHTDRFVISVSDVAQLTKLTLNMKSINGGSLQITNLTVALVMESGQLQINEQDEYLRTGATEYLCEDTVDKIPAFELVLPTGRNILQEIYMSEHDPIKLDTKNSTWISAVSRVPNSQNDTLNIYVYPAEDANGDYEIDVRAQFTNIHGTILETGANNIEKTVDAEGKTVYAVYGLTATTMSTLNRVFVKAESYDVVDAYIDHVVVQQVRAGVVVNTFYLDCEHRNADREFYALATHNQALNNREQKVYLSFGKDTQPANLLAENRDVAIALQYKTVNGGDELFTSKYIYITDQQYKAIQAGDIIELTFNESYVHTITGILIATSGNIQAQVDMVCIDNYKVNPATGAKQLLNHFAASTAVMIQNQTKAMAVSEKTSVEMLNIHFITAAADAYLESGTTDPIVMVLYYTDIRGVQREAVLTDIRDYVISEGEAFSTGSTTQIRLLMKDVASIQSLKLMPYNSDPRSTAVWKPSQIIVSLGTDGALQKVNRTIEITIQEDKELDLENPITGAMVGGLKVNLANIIVSADVKATNTSGAYGNSYRINSAVNNTMAMNVVSGASVCVNVAVSNSTEGYSVIAEQNDGLMDISNLIVNTEEGFIMTMPKNSSGQDQVYRITVSSTENEKVTVVIEVTVKSQANPDIPADSTETT